MEELQEKIAYDIVEKILGCCPCFYQYVVVMLQCINIGKIVCGFFSKNNSLCAKKSIKNSSLPYIHSLPCFI
jgi:hypothetical protein